MKLIKISTTIYYDVIVDAIDCGLSCCSVRAKLPPRVHGERVPNRHVVDVPRREEPAEETSVEARLNRAPSIAVITHELGRAHIDIVIDLHHATCSLAIARISTFQTRLVYYLYKIM